MKKTILLFGISIISFCCLSQEWRLGGNTDFGPPPQDGLVSNSNYLGSIQNTPIVLGTNGLQRLTILGNIGGLYNRNGFIGINDPNPSFHLDINTQEPDGNQNYGELMLRARIVDDPNAYISFVNLATQGQILSPTLMGRQSENSSPALSTLGSITILQDNAVNTEPVTRFFSTRAYDPTTGVLGIQRLNVVNNRRIFGWYNGVDRLMTMEANGFLGVATSNPGNRVEINSDFYGTFGSPTGTPLGGPFVTFLTLNGFPAAGGGNATGFSGLRFTDLTAGSIPQANNPGGGVLELNSDGDVIYVESAEASSGGFVQCTNNGIAGNLTSDSKLNLNNFQLYFENNDVLGLNHTGFGYNCGSILPAKVSVFQNHPSTVNQSTTAISGINDDQANVNLLVFTGVYGQSYADQHVNIRPTNIGGDFLAGNAVTNIGVRGNANSPLQNGNETNIGVYGTAVDLNAVVNHGGYFEGSGSAQNTGVYANSIGNLASINGLCYGVLSLRD